MESLLLGLFGLIPGLITSLIGIKEKAAFALWVAIYITWFIILGDDASMMNMFLISVIAGLVNGITCFVLVDKHIESNPWAKEEFDKLGEKAAQTLLMFSLGMGVAFGVILAGISWLLI